jgi:hypothetical protein
MPNKKVTIIVYGADRNLWAGDPCHLTITDVNDGTLMVLMNRNIRGTTIEVDLNVPFDAGQIYGIQVKAAGHRPAWQLVRRRSFLREEGGREIERPDTILRLMLVPDHPKSEDVANGFQELARRGSRLSNVWTLPEPYSDLETRRQMALLNIEAKLRETYVGSSSLISFVTGLRGIDPDRLFILVNSELKAIVERSRDFAGAPGHGAPGEHAGVPAHPDSWKSTLFGAGNVQLSFSAETEPWPKEGKNTQSCYSVDVDIDLERGLAHVGEWLDNNVVHRDKKTDQTLVYALLYSQGILPCYTLSQTPQATQVVSKKRATARKVRSATRQST